MAPLRQNMIRAVLAIAAVFAVTMTYAALPWPYALIMDGLPVLWVPMLPVVIAILWLILRSLSKMDDVTAARTAKIIIAATCAAQLLITILADIRAPYFIPTDVNNIYQAASDMIAQGTTTLVPTTELPHYFEIYPHNINTLILIYWLFRAGHTLGMRDYNLIGQVLGVMCMLSCYTSLYSIAKHAHKAKMAAYTTVLLCMNMSFLMFIPSYYTDIISIGFLAPAAAIAVKYAVTDQPKQKLSAVIAGILLAAAIKIRITSIFLPLAAIMYGLISGKLKERAKQYAKTVLLTISGFTIAWICIGALYSYHMPLDTTDTELPLTHWLMMGACDDNHYNYCGTCTAFSVHWPTKEEKTVRTWNAYLEKVQKKGPIGVIAMLVSKEMQTWAAGDPLIDTDAIKPPGESKVYDSVFGVNSAPMRVYLGVYNFILFALITAAAVIELKKPTANTILAILLLGAALFYAFWEAGKRYSISFLPYMTLFTAPALNYVANTPPKQACRALINAVKGG